MTANQETSLRELAARLRHMALKCQVTTGKEADRLGVTYATLVPGLSGWVADDLNAAADALSARDEAGAVAWPVAFTKDNGPGKVVGLEWNPSYPVHELTGRVPLYLATPSGVDDDMVRRAFDPHEKRDSGGAK